MKVRLTLVAAALTALVAVGCSSAAAVAVPRQRLRARPRRRGPPPRAARRRSPSRVRSPARWRRSARSSCTSPSSPCEMDNAANGTKITIVQGDTQLKPAQATTVTRSSSRLEDRGVVGPAGSQEVEAVGPLFGARRAGVHLRSATAPALTRARTRRSSAWCPTTTSRARRTPTTSSNNLHPKAVMVVDDQRPTPRPGRRDDADLPEGRDQGRPESVTQRPRLHLAGDQGHARHDGRVPAVADRGQRAAVRPTRRSSTRRP